MSSEARYKKRKEFVDLMIETKGKDFALGWLKTSYIYNHAEASEDHIIDVATKVFRDDAIKSQE